MNNAVVIQIAERLQTLFDEQFLSDIQLNNILTLTKNKDTLKGLVELL